MVPPSRRCSSRTSDEFDWRNFAYTQPGNDEVGVKGADFIAFMGTLIIRSTKDQIAGSSIVIATDATGVSPTQTAV
jgi:hypothetical protein